MGYDSCFVVGSVLELEGICNVAKRPNAVDRRAQVGVGHDIAAFVEFDPTGLDFELVAVGNTSCCHEDLVDS